MSGLVVGEVLHGFCGGAFGRDHYECSRIEAIGPDWIVVRGEDSELGFTSGRERLARLSEYRQEGDYCPSHPCLVQPGPDAAVGRVRALHREEYGYCSECGDESMVQYPCPTIRALDRTDQEGRVS